MRIPVKAQIRRIEQANTLTVFWTLNLNLSDVIVGSLRRIKATWLERKFESLKWYDLVVKLRKPTAEHQFSYLYEQLVKRFGENVDWRFVLKESVKSALMNIQSPYTWATFILNEFFNACDDLTQQWQPPFECIEQKREIKERIVKVADTPKQIVEKTPIVEANEPTITDNKKTSDIEKKQPQEAEVENEEFVVSTPATEDEIKEMVQNYTDIMDDLYINAGEDEPATQPSVKTEKVNKKDIQTLGTGILWSWIPWYTGSYIDAMENREIWLYGK